MINSFKKIIEESGVLQRVDLIEVGTLDLNSGDLKRYSFGELADDSIEYFFDLASVTKLFTNGFIASLNPEVLKNDDLKLCLEHTSGIPSWGLLSKSKWKQEVESFNIKKSSTLYSDYGAIRAMLLFEKISGQKLYSVCREIWDEDIFHWMENRDLNRFLKTGCRKSGSIFSEVHDPNAFNIKEELTHAGLFATTEGVLRTIKRVFKNGDLKKTLIQSKIANEKKRFHLGWDTPSEEGSLAGDGCSTLTFGHLGFTGTSVWVDLEKGKAISILSNVTRDGWYKKNELNKVRRLVGKAYWDL
tara:strand:+ start:2146 stop:3048 length:903 start_codon:yes stop_codon:yes gene_type:complete